MKPSHSRFPCAALAALAMPSLASARTAFDAAAAPAPGTSLVRLLLALGVVVALVYAVAWLLRRSGRHRVGSRGRLMEVVDVLPLGPRSRLVAVRIGGRTVVVGAGDHAVTPVAELEPDAAGVFRAGDAPGRAGCIAAAGAPGPAPRGAAPDPDGGAPGAATPPGDSVVPFRRRLLRLAGK